jgi:hypothetical protein
LCAAACMHAQSPDHAHHMIYIGQLQALARPMVLQLVRSPRSHSHVLVPLLASLADVFTHRDKQSAATAPK